MKKKILILAFGLVAIAANAVQNDYPVVGTEVITTCGKHVYTVSSSFFGSISEYEDYLRDINEINCGTRSLPHFIDHLTK